MKKSKQIRSHTQLIVRKQELRTVIAGQQEQLQADLIQLKEAFWPFEMLNRFKGNLQSFTENSLVAVGIEIAKLALQYFLSRKKESESSASSTMGFLSNLLEHFTKKPSQQQESNS